MFRFEINSFFVKLLSFFIHLCTRFHSLVAVCFFLSFCSIGTTRLFYVHLLLFLLSSLSFFSVCSLFFIPLFLYSCQLKYDQISYNYTNHIYIYICYYIIYIHNPKTIRVLMLLKHIFFSFFFFCMLSSIISILYNQKKNKNKKQTKQ